MTNELKQEYTLKISQANRTAIIVIVYEIALSYLEDAKTSFAEDNMDDYKSSIKQAKNCIAQLIDALNFDYEISYRLMELYTFANRELVQAIVKKDTSHIDSAVKIIKSLHSSFSEVQKEDDSKPVMENTQTVYAGLTYGKTTLNENIGAAGLSRGFCV